MAGSGQQSAAAADRPTVVKVQEQTHELEGRVTGLERDMQHTLQLVEATSRTVDAGFAETRRMFHEAAERDTRQAAEIHARIDEQQKAAAKKGQVSWPLVISAIVASVVIGGVFVSFVNMSLGPIRTNIERLTTKDDSDDVSERTMTAQVATMEANVAQNRNDLLDIRQQRRTARPDPFYGREGTAMEECIRALETFVRDAIAKEKNGSYD